jgi:hypothetical protein
MRIHPRRRDEQGAALPVALAVLIVCSIVTALLTQYTSNGLLAGTKLADQRSNEYAASGGVDSAIKYLQSDALLKRGAADGSDSSCPAGSAAAFVAASGINGEGVQVTCQSDPSGAGSGGALTKSPGFAVLTTAPYHGAAPGGGGSSFPNCDNLNDEAGIAQVQNDKLLTVHGNVYVNSDVDSDIWANGCPQTSTAEHIQVVNGDAIVRESNHDLDVATAGHLHAAPVSNTQVAPYATRLLDPGSDTSATKAEWTAPFDAPPAAGTITDINGSTISSCPSARTPTNVPFVHFTAGTYSDASVLSNFTDGDCPGALLWFAPGAYYFDFANGPAASTSKTYCTATVDAGQCAHQWLIDDKTVRVVGGQENATAVARESQENTFAAQRVSNVSVFNSAATNNAATVIDGVTNNASYTSGTATITLSNFLTQTGTAIPPDATIDHVYLRVVHREDTPALATTPTYSITPAGASSACTGLPGLTMQAPAGGGLGQDRVEVTSCLNTAAAIDLGPTIKYSVGHTGSGTENEHLDGLVLVVDYHTAGRPAWSATAPATITPSSPAVPGACRHETDAGWSHGDEFVFGGDSRVFLKTGRFEVCDEPSTTKQEITLMGLRAAPAPSAVGTTWTPTSYLAGTTFTNPANGEAVGGGTATAALSTTTTSRSITLTQFTPTTWPVPAANLVPTDAIINKVELDVTHSDSSTSQLNAPTLAVTSGTTSCSPATLARHTNLTATGADLVDLTSCLNTPALLNAGINAQFTTTRASSSPTETLDGMQLKVTYTPQPPCTPTGGLTPGCGCTTKAPYYHGGDATADHAPAYNGACALFRVASDTAGGQFPRVVTFWGTVYAPSAALDMPVDVLTVPVFNRGVVARMLMLGYNVANNAVVPITTDVLLASLSNRRVTLTATEGNSKVTADVEFCDYDATPCGGQPQGVKIWSWKVQR